MKFVFLVVVAFVMNESCSGQISNPGIENTNTIKIVPFSRPKTCKSTEKEIHSDLIDNSNTNFLNIYTRLIQVETKCRFGKDLVPTIEQYRFALNAVIDTIKTNGVIKPIMENYDNALLKLNRDFRKFSGKKGRSLTCFNILPDIRRAAASVGESLVIAALIIRETECPTFKKKPIKSH